MLGMLGKVHGEGTLNGSTTGAPRRGCPKVTKAQRSRVVVRRSEGLFESRTGCVVSGGSVACKWESSEEDAECPDYWDRLLRPETRDRGTIRGTDEMRMRCER